MTNKTMNNFKFKCVFLAVVSFTLLSGAGSFWLASQGNLTPEQNRLFETCNTTWNMGIVGIVGLLSMGDDEEDNQE